MHRSREILKFTLLLMTIGSIFLAPSQHAVAQTNPCLVSVIRTPGAILLTALESLKMVSTSLGSFPMKVANLSATGEGSMVLRSTVRPSARDTIT